MVEALPPSETSFLTRATRHNIPKDGVIHSHRRENLKSYITLTGWDQWWRNNVSPVMYEFGSYIPETTFFFVVVVKYMYYPEPRFNQKHGIWS
jgi:hypothetical protein